MNSSRLKICFLLILLGLIADTSFAQATFLHEDFSTCISNLPNGWQKYSVTGTDTWGCTSGGQTGKGVTMSVYSSGNNHDNEDWLISPQIDLSSYTNPSLSFWCRTKYSGAFIQVFVSANYSGSGNPNTATWTTLPVVLPTSKFVMPMGESWNCVEPSSKGCAISARSIVIIRGIRLSSRGG